MRTRCLAISSLALACSLSLASLGAFAQTQPQSRPDSAGAPAVVIDAVALEGAAGLPAETQAAIATGLQGDTVHSDWLAKLKSRALRQFQNEGFLDATAEPKIQSSRLVDGKEHVTITLSVVTGVSYSIQNVWWSGSSVFSLAELQSLSLLRPGDIFRISALGESLSLLQREYAQRGYPEMYLDTSFQKFPETRKVAVYLVIQEGPKAGDSASHQCKPLSNEEIRNAAYVPSVAYDPAIDPQMQVARAQLEAARTHKRLLLIVGGTWCGWCRILDQTFRQNPELSELRDKNFVVVHLDGSDSAKTDCALQPYPPPQGYPFVYAFDAAGKLIAADNTGAWQSADGYNPKQIEFSLSKWSAFP